MDDLGLVVLGEHPADRRRPLGLVDALARVGRRRRRAALLAALAVERQVHDADLLGLGALGAIGLLVADAGERALDVVAVVVVGVLARERDERVVETHRDEALALGRVGVVRDRELERVGEVGQEAAVARRDELVDELDLGRRRVGGGEGREVRQDERRDVVDDLLLRVGQDCEGGECEQESARPRK